MRLVRKRFYFPIRHCLPPLEDKEITKRLYECGELLGIDLVDSVIIGE